MDRATLGKWYRKFFGQKKSPVRRGLQDSHLNLQQLESRINPAPIPTIQGLAAPGSNQPLLGQNTTFSFNFTNTSPTDVGYSPFISVAVDTSGPDGAATAPLDGYGTPTVTGAGPYVLVGQITLAAGQTTYVNPFTGGTENVPAGFGKNDTIYIYRLPFGSFTPGQTTAISVTLPISKLADINTPLPFAVTPGFRDDEPADNGPPILGTSKASDATPQLYVLRKIYNGPESETATGPNYVRNYTLQVDIAPGVTLTNLRISDVLPASFQIVGRDTTVVQGNPNFSATINGGPNTFTLSNLSTTGGASTSTMGFPNRPNAPGGTFTYTFASVTGGTGADDASVSFNYFIPRNDSGSSPTIPQGTDSTSATNNSSALANWVPFDTRDTAFTNVGPSASLSSPSHTLEQQSLAVQKSQSLFNLTTGAPITGPIQPGRTLVRNVLNFQVSDYFALQNVILNDLVSDGQRLFLGTLPAALGGGTATPTLSVNQAFIANGAGPGVGSRVNSAAAPFTANGVVSYQGRFTIGNPLSDPSLGIHGYNPSGPTGGIYNNLGQAPDTSVTSGGTTFLRFNISQELIQRLGPNAGRLVGALVANDGSGQIIPDQHPQTPPAPAVTGQIVFYTLVSEEFSDAFPSGNPSVDQGDVLNNRVEDTLTPQRDGIIAQQISTTTVNAATPTVIGIASDDSGASFSIPYGVQEKRLTHVNGVAIGQGGSAPISVQAGDVVTYQLTYTLPITSFENLTLIDIPPLPVMPVGSQLLYSLDLTLPTSGGYNPDLTNPYNVALAPTDTFFQNAAAVGTPVSLATLVPLPGATYNPAGGGGLGTFTFGAAPTIDGVTVTAGMRILVKDQVDQRQNGIWFANTATSWTRAVDFNQVAEVQNSRVFVATNGTQNLDLGFVNSNGAFTTFNGAPGDTSAIRFTPFIQTDTTTNQIRFVFGNLADTGIRQFSTISLYLSLPVGNQPFGSDLFLTNQLRVNEASTNSGDTTVEALQLFELVRPNVNIQKGVVGANSTGFTLGGITFTAPSTAPNFSGGPIFNSTQANAIGARNIGLTDNVDAGDRVRYAIVSQNSGRGDAFDVVIADQLPAGLLIPPTIAGLGLTLFRGDGTALATTANVTGYVRAATETDIGGTFNAGVGGGQFTGVFPIIDDVQLRVGDRVLVKDQTTASQNGIYTVTARDPNTGLLTLTRSTDANTAATLSGYRVAIMGGTTSADNHFQFGTVATLNVSPANAGSPLGVRDYFTTYNPVNGAFTILLSDNYTAGNVNTQVPNGDGGDIRTGSLSRGDRAVGGAITNGSNTIVVLYDAVLANTVTPNQTIVNTASVPNYASTQGGPDLTDPNNVPGATDPSDTATVRIKLPILQKTLDSTEVTAPGNNGTGGAGAQATIGELVTYTITIAVPEGQTPGAQIVDTLDNGLAFEQIIGVTASSGLTAGIPLTLAGVQGAAVIGPVGGQAGRSLTINLGTINNPDNNNSTIETITVTYRVVVLNTNGAGGSADNQAGQTRNNLFDFNWQNNATTTATIRAGQSTNASGTATGTATPVTIVEPTLTNLKDVINITQGESFGTPGANQITRGDQGDTIQYRITIANPATGSTTANDVTLSDPLPTTFFTGGFTVFSVTQTGGGQVRRNGTSVTLNTTDFVISGGTLTFNPANNYDIEPNVEIRVIVQGLGFTGAAGLTVNNVANLQWTSLDDQRTLLPGANPTINNPAGVERTGADGEGAGNLNNYADNDDAQIASPIVIRKTIVATSEAHTTSSSVAIGEIVRYRIVASVPEGLSRNFQLADIMPSGLAFLNDGTARYVFVSSDGASIASATVGPVPGLTAVGFIGDQNNINSLPSSSITGIFGDANISPNANGPGTGDPTVYGTQVFFRFGTLTNNDNDTDVEYVVVEFNALVLNVTAPTSPFGNQAGGVRTNQMTALADIDNNGTAGFVDVVLDANGDGVGTGEPTISANDPSNNATGTPAVANGPDVTIVEPNVQINKEVIATDGNVVTYRITLTNPTGTNVTTAFNTRVLDILNSANFSLVSATLTPVLTGGAAGFTNNSSVGTNTIDATIDILPVGGSVVFTYQVNVLTTTSGTASLDNTAKATFTGLPGDFGTGGNWTGIVGTSSKAGSTIGGGVTFIGLPGTPTGERTGQDGGPPTNEPILNNYAVQDTERLGTLGDRVYFDANGDGIQQVGEPGIVGVPVTVRWAGPDGIFGNGDDSVITVNTGSDGKWTIKGLPLGANQKYQVSVPTTIGGMSLTDVRDNGGAPNTNPDGLGVGISAITLTGVDAGTTNNVIQDFGYRGTAKIGDRVYIDANGDGVQDSNGLEPSLPGVTVNLTWAGLDGIFGNGDDLTFTTVSKATAGTTPNYLFDFLPSGNFKVSASTTGGVGGVPSNSTMTDALDNGGAPSTDPTGSGAGFVQLGGTGGSPIAALATGEFRQTIDFGYKGTASIGDTVWYDANGNGVQDTGEPGIPGVTVTLLWAGPDGNLGTADDVTFTTKTDANGKYLFPGLPVNGSGSPYQVTVTQPASFPVQTFDKSGPLDNKSNLTLGPTENNVDQDFGYRGTAKLGDFVWEDLNGNGKQDVGEPGISGVTVQLYYDADGDGTISGSELANPLLTTTTDSNGKYSFENLAAGKYQVKFIQPSGFVTTKLNSPVASSTTDSDADPTTGFTSLVTLANGENNPTIDAGYYKLVTLGNKVFFDINKDGVQQAGEPGIGGVSVTVVWLGEDGVFGGGDDKTFTTTTGPDGIWSVTGLPPGNFKVTVATPTGYTTLTDSLDNGGAPSPVNPVTVSTNSGVNRDDIDFGFVGNAKLGDFVYVDADGDGVQDTNGLEPGIPGVTVTLRFDADNDGSFTGPNDGIFTTVTDANGKYLFQNLPAGKYEISVSATGGTGGVPSNMTLTDSLDNGVLNPAAAVTQTLALGDNVTTIDFGYKGTASIGDTVWYDANGNGVQDTGEPGIPGVTVTLLWAGPDGNLGTADDVTFTTKTDANGKYLFPGLPVNGSGSPYQVTVTQPASFPVQTFDKSGPLDNKSNLTLGPTENNVDQDFGYRGTAKLGDFVWEDLNGNGKQDVGEPGISGVTVQLYYDADGDGTISGSELANPLLTTTTDSNGKYSFENLAAGKYQVKFIQPSGFVTTKLNSPVASSTTDSDADPTTGFTSLVTLANGENNPTIDAGYYKLVTLGNKVFFDINKDGVQQAGEPGIGGVSVTVVWLGEDGVFGGGDDKTFTTTTGPDGIWSVTGLPPGNFKVTVATPTGYTTLTDSLDNGGAPSPVNPVTVSTNSGVNRDDIDFGFVGNAKLGDRVWLDLNSDGVQDPNEPGLQGLTVTLVFFGGDGIEGTADDAVITTVTGPDGKYLFENLPAGNYRVSVDTTGTNLSPTFDLDGKATPNTTLTTLSIGQNREDVDFGLIGNASVGDFVYIDHNADGIQQPTEPGIPGAKVQLTWAGPDGVLGTSDDVVLKTTTDSKGKYLFAGLPVYGDPDNYRVEVTSLPVAGFVLTDSLDNGGSPSPINPVDVLVSGVDGDPLNARRDVDFGYDGTASLSGNVYVDSNNNGKLDPGETGIPGVTITLTGVDPFGNPILDPLTGLPFTTVTDATGKYSFPTLVPGVYNLVETQPPAYGDGLDAAGTPFGGNTSNDKITGIVVTAGGSGIDYNFGELGAKLSGFVWVDSNKDGIFDASEKAIPGVLITLTGTDINGNPVSLTATTDAAGKYQFLDLPASNAAGYTITETQPLGYADSPGTPATIRSGVVVPAGGNITQQNFGELLGSISGKVYVDLNSNGVLNTGEPGISNVPITLTGTDINGNPVNITVFTDTNGNYKIDNLFPPQTGTKYTLTEGSTTPPYTDKASNVGTGFATPGTSSTPNVISDISFTPGQVGVNYNFGELQSTQPFISGSVYVDTNRDGKRDSGEEPIPGVTITLFGFGPDGVFGTADDPAPVSVLTDANGFYLFPNLVAGQNYKVIETQPNAYGNSPVGPTVQIGIPNLPATGSTNNNFGEILGSIAGKVYFDSNKNGLLDTGEPGIAGVTVTLTGTDVDGNPVSKVAVTDAKGNYLFPELKAGVYKLVETQPTDYAQGSNKAGTSGGTLVPVDTIQAINLGAGVDATNYLFGEVGVGVSGVVFLDRDQDGTISTGDGVVPGVTIRLVDENGNVVATTVTGPDGKYSFPNVPPGKYQIVEEQPLNYGDTPTGPFQPNTRSITVASTPITDQNFGEVLGQISGFVYVDANNNGLFETGELPISGVQVTLVGTDAAGNKVNLSTTTDASGKYVFTDLPISDLVGYTITQTQPAGFLDGKDTVGTISGIPIGANSSNDVFTGVVLGSGQKGIEYNFGELQAGVNSFIAGTVYLDVNNNGVQDPGEPGIAGVTVTLTGPGGSVVVTTGPTGNYLFTDLTPNDSYTITQTQPPQFGSGLENTSNVINIPSLSPSGSTGNNFGEIGGQISGTVYLDVDKSGSLTGADKLLSGVQVQLLDNKGNPVNDLLTGKSYVLTTDASGNYSFVNLPAGQYKVVETQPTGLDQGTNTPGTFATLGGTDEILVNLPAAGNSPGNNFGELNPPPTFVSGTVFLDSNKNGTQNPGEPGIAGVVINLLDSNGNLVATTTTGPDGSYIFTGITPGSYQIQEVQPTGYGNSPVGPAILISPVTVPPAGLTNQNFGETLGSLSGLVYLDANKNGQFDTGEVGIAGTLVTLTGVDANGKAVVLTTTTDASGKYVFDNLLAGTYKLIETQPVGYDDGLETIGSLGGFHPTSDLFTGIVLPGGGNGTGYNFGEFLPALPPGKTFVAGTVYHDNNQNGKLDGGEKGIGGVTVQLQTPDGKVVATTTTNPDGTYSFPNIAPGNYKIVETQPTGYGSSTPNTLSVTVPSTGLTNQNFGETLGSLAGTVYLDLNNNGKLDAGEAGIAGVQVTLTGTDAAGNPVNLVTTTDANGKYLFSNLFASDASGYTINETQPSGFLDGLDAVGKVNGVTTGIGGNDVVNAIVLPPGGVGVSYDFGELPPPVQPGKTFLTGTVYVDNNKNGNLDGGEKGLGGVTIELQDPSGTVIATTTTNPDGTYSFVDILPGDYKIVETQPTGYGSSTPNTLSVTVPSAGLTNQNFGETLSTLAGSVYVDLSNDGVRQVNEPGIGGVTIELWDANTNTKVATTKTAPDGSYIFTGLLEGKYFVVQPTQPAGYGDGLETVGSAGGDTLTNEKINNIPVGAGADLINYNFGELGASIFGKSYYDVNQDGKLQGSEKGLSGVIVQLLDDSGKVLASTITGPDGSYSFVGLPGGNYKILETQPVGYGSSTPNLLSVTLPDGVVVRDQDFGNTLGSIQGVVYSDLNNNGQQDPGEPGIANVPITLTGTDVSGKSVTITVQSGPDGKWAFTDLFQGTYMVVEATQPAAFLDGKDKLGTGGGTLGNDVFSGITLPPGNNLVNYQFGEVLPATISGKVYRDDNANGKLDPGEPGIAGVVITLTGTDANGLPVTKTTVTDANGNYIFTQVSAGLYTISETQPSDFANGGTNVGSLGGIQGNDVISQITIPPGANGVNYNFGELGGEIHGTVFEDIDRDGVLDPNETGIPGVIIRLLDSNGTIIRETVTGPDGTYSFVGFPPGTYIVEQIQPAGYGSSSPNRVIVNVPPAAVINDINFGETFAAVSGYVYRDFSVDGIRTPSAGETGIGGVTITLIGTDVRGNVITRVTTTDVNGFYNFDGLFEGTYQIIETQPNGFYYDGLDTVGNFGGIGRNDLLIVTLPAGGIGIEYNFGENPPADPFGFVYWDVNRNGVMDDGEPGIAGVTIQISGIAFPGTPLERVLTAADVPGGLTRVTGSDGRWEFAIVPPGVYTVIQVNQPVGFEDGLEQDGDRNGPFTVIVGNERFDNIELRPLPIRGPFNFGEFKSMASGEIDKEMFLASTNGNGLVIGGPLQFTPSSSMAPTFAVTTGNPTQPAYVVASAGPGSLPLLRVFDFATGGEIWRMSVFEDSFTGGVRTALADVNGDGIPDIIAAAGPGGGPRIRIIDGATGQVINDFMAYAPDFRGGLFVAAGDIDGDGIAEIVTGADAGGGPHIQVFDSRTGRSIGSFFAYESSFRGGARVAVGDTDGDGIAEIITGAGFGGGPLVRVFDGRTFDARRSLFAFGQTLRNGVFVTTGDVDGDGVADLVIGAGEGGGPAVTIRRGQDNSDLGSYFAFDPNFMGGVRVATQDIDGDGQDEIVAATGAGSTQLAIRRLRDGVDLERFFPLDNTFRGGVFVG